jgi:hypothetical protein
LTSDHADEPMMPRWLRHSRVARPRWTTRALFRLTALAGIASAVVLVFNFLRRAEVVPDVAATQALAPLSATFGLIAVTGLFATIALRTLLPDAAAAAGGGFAAAAGLTVMSLTLYRRMDDARAVPRQTADRTDSTVVLTSSR